MPSEHAPLVETHSIRLFEIFLQERHLPFSRYCRGVTCALHNLTYGTLFFVFWKGSPTGLKAKRVASRHQGYSGGVAHGHAVAMLEFHTVLC